MLSKTIEVQGIPVNYYESSGKGLPVLLLHGNSMSGRTFVKQLESDLGEQYRLIAPDLPGLGKSQPLSDPSTQAGLAPWASIFKSFLDALGIEEVVLYGWSLGGHIALEMVPQLPKLRGVIIQGTPPLGKPPAMDQAFLTHPSMAVAFKEQLNLDEIKSFVEACFAPGYPELPNEFIEDMQQSDGRTRTAVSLNVAQQTYLDELEIVRNLQVPLAILHGAQEQLLNGAYFADLEAPTLWRNAVQVIERAGHAPHWETPDEFNGLIAAFISDLR
jgi:pimeloyl-ACP methyl ester carboxylesterase